MPKVKEYPTALAKAVIEAIRRGQALAAVAKYFDLSRQIVSVWNRFFRSRETVNTKQRTDRPRKTIMKVDRFIRRKSVDNSQITTVDIENDLSTSYNINIHVYTVKRCINKVKVYIKDDRAKSHLSL